MKTYKFEKKKKTLLRTMVASLHDGPRRFLPLIFRALCSPLLYCARLTFTSRL